MAGMTEAAKQARNAYIREWRKNHPDKVRAYNAAYWKKKADKVNEESEALKKS